MAELSQQAGFSASFLSLVERGKSSPSMTSLRKVADALQVPMSAFLPGSPGNGALVHRAGESHSAIVLGQPQVVYQLLSSAHPDRKLEPMIVVHHPVPAGEPDPEPYSHAGEEFCYVFEGRLTFNVAGQVHLLGPGDSIHVDSTVPHICFHRGAAPARSLWVLTPKIL